MFIHLSMSQLGRDSFFAKVGSRFIRRIAGLDLLTVLSLSLVDTACTYDKGVWI